MKLNNKLSPWLISVSKEIVLAKIVNHVPLPLPMFLCTKWRTIDSRLKKTRYSRWWHRVTHKTMIKSVRFWLFQTNQCELSFSSIPVRSRTSEKIVFVAVQVICLINFPFKWITIYGLTSNYHRQTTNSRLPWVINESIWPITSILRCKFSPTFTVECKLLSTSVSFVAFFDWTGLNWTWMFTLCLPSVTAFILDDNCEIHKEQLLLGHIYPSVHLPC